MWVFLGLIGSAVTGGESVAFHALIMSGGGDGYSFEFNKLILYNRMLLLIKNF